MTLLELPSGMVSLEYAVAEQAEVDRRLGAIAKVSVLDHITYALVQVGDESFVHMADWDEPCLIAQSARGNAILRRVCGLDLTDSAIAAK